MSGQRKYITDFTSQISGLQFDYADRVAAGSFGDVYRRTVKSSGRKMEVAVKVFKINPSRSIDKLIKAMHRELGVSLRLNHPRIVPLLGTAMVGSPLPALVYQWMSSGTFSEYLEKTATILTHSVRLRASLRVSHIVRQCPSRRHFSQLSSENVIHGDLHPGNVLIDDSGSPCLADFGLATVAGDPDLQWSTTTAGRLFDSRWRAPEVLGIHSNPQRPEFKSDMYSFGSVIFFIISGNVPWKERTPIQICIGLSNGAIPMRPENISDDCWGLIKMCWAWEQESRPEAGTVLQFIAKNRQQKSNSYDFSCTTPDHSKAAAPLSKKRTWETDEGINRLLSSHRYASPSMLYSHSAAIEYDTEANQVRGWRFKLQKAFLRIKEIYAVKRLWWIRGDEWEKLVTMYMLISSFRCHGI